MAVVFLHAFAFATEQYSKISHQKIIFWPSLTKLNIYVQRLSNLVIVPGTHCTVPCKSHTLFVSFQVICTQDVPG